MSIHFRALGFDYEGTECELPDCEMDAEGWDDRLSPYSKSGGVINDKKGTLRDLLAAIDAMAAKKQSNDAFIISYSGHGTTDIVDGKPAQGIVLSDLSVVWEFELRQYLAKLSPAIFFADCCYARGLDRAIVHHARTIPVSKCVTHDAKRPAKMPPTIHAVYYACTDKETAASTGNGGAMSLAGYKAFDERQDSTTFAGLATRIAKLLPSKQFPYQQHPSFVCKDAAFAKRTLRSFNKSWNKKPAT